MGFEGPTSGCVRGVACLIPCMGGVWLASSHVWEGCGLPHPHPFPGSSGGVCTVLSQEGGEDDPDGCQEGPQKANTGGGHSLQGKC